MPSIGLDIDGVLADFTYGFTREHARMFGGKPWSCGAQPHWRFDLPQDEINEVWRAVDKSDDFWYMLPPIAGFGEFETLRQVERAYNVVYVTNRSGGVNYLGQTREWLRNRGLVGELVATPDKTDALSLLPNLLGHIEDSPTNIEDLKAHGLPVFIRDWPYNRHVEGERVGSVAEFLRRVTA